MAIQTNEGPKRGKQNGYCSTTIHKKHDQRRRDAEARQAKYDDLTTKDKIALVKGRRGNSKKELTRLEARLAAEKATKKAEKKSA